MKMFKAIVLVFGLCSILNVNALEIGVTGGTVKAKPIAVVPFVNNNDNEKVDFIISADLKQSGVFAPVAPTSYNNHPTLKETVNYSEFQQLNIPYVVVGELVNEANSKSIRFALIDTYQGKVLGSYTVSSANNVGLRMSAHKVSDVILQKLTGVRGAFATKIVYVHEFGSGSSRHYSIMMSDSDGANTKTLVSSDTPLMSPRFSPDINKVAYVSFEGARAKIMIYDIGSSQKTVVSSEPGMNSSPAWSPNGARMAMVLSKDGNPEVYIKDLATKALTRVTNSKSIDTEPVWAGNGSELYFTSDRTGSPQLYKINLATGQLVKVTNAGNYSAGADVSNDGKKIAFARNESGRFIIGTININGSDFKGVSSGFVDETPRFSPNGQMLIYTSLQNNRQVLKVVNVDGSGENVLSSSGQIRDPDWSTYVQ